MDLDTNESRCMVFGKSGTFVSGSTTPAPGNRLSSRYLTRSQTSKKLPNAE
ncbi:hypothetical protein D3C83_173500 [compost metagenome]